MTTNWLLSVVTMNISMNTLNNVILKLIHVMFLKVWMLIPKPCQLSSVQLNCSVVWDSLRPHESQHNRPPCPSPTPWVYSDSRPSSPWCHPAILILGRPFLLLPTISPSIRLFSNQATLSMRWPKYWTFSFSIIPSKEIPGLISFRMDSRAVGIWFFQ